MSFLGYSLSLVAVSAAIMIYFWLMRIL